MDIRAAQSLLRFLRQSARSNPVQDPGGQPLPRLPRVSQSLRKQELDLARSEDHPLADLPQKTAGIMCVGIPSSGHSGSPPSCPRGLLHLGELEARKGFVLLPRLRVVAHPFGGKAV